MIEMEYVDSTDLEAIGYDDSSSELHVRFRKSPETYVYPGVPREIFEELRLADSKGRYFNQNIKPAYKQFYKR